MDPRSAEPGGVERRVVPLRDAAHAGRSLAGGKAANLGRLMRIGMPVPDGFVITTVAYREHAGRAFARFDASGPKKVGSWRSDAIMSTPVDTGLRDEVARALEPMLGSYLAVRSSAVAEDTSERSFAGVYTTRLGVREVGACIDAMTACWASLWSDAPKAYRHESSVGDDEPAMSVIVQTLVDAEASGVLFSADPASGRRDHLVIEAVLGLGEALVSGRARPDRIVVQKRPFRILAEEIAVKTTRLRPDEHGGTRENPPSEVEASLRAVSRQQVRSLTLLAARIEQDFGRPVDVEWALERGRVRILQARAITVLPEPQYQQVWSNVNTGEVFPGVVSPFSWSMVKEVARTLRELMRSFGIDPGDAPLVGRVAGRVYFNVNTLIGLFKSMPGSRFIDVNMALGGAQGDSLDPVVLAAIDPVKVRRSLATALWRAPANLLWLARHQSAQADRYYQQRQASHADLRAVDLTRMSEGELLARVERLFHATLDGAESIAFMGAGSSSLFMLSILTRRWLGDADGSAARRLLTGIGGISSAEAALDMWRLAALARTWPAVAARLREHDDAIEAWQWLRQDGDAADFLRAFQGFLDEHGHHARSEIDVYSPRWSDEPQQVLSIVRRYLDSDGFDPVAMQATRQEQARDLIEDCRRRLGNPVKRRVFTSVVRSAREASVRRENLKSVAVAFTALLRGTLRELGVRWAAQGRIDHPEDVFFLELDELPNLREEADRWKARIAERRASYEMHLSVTPASIVIGENHRPVETAAASASHPDTLNGLAASSGVARGRARVLEAAHRHAVVRAGEVLVAPFTDPGWTPAFLPAVAVVVDLGGLLSHGSILAREYGIPAVVNVGDATRRIASGDLVEVDGNAGVVRILKRATTPRADSRYDSAGERE